MFHTFRYCVLALTALLLVACSGCGGAPYKMVPFEGTITYKGKPLENVVLEFAVGDHRTSGAYIVPGEQGRFKVVHTSTLVGVPVGTCRLKVTWGGGESVAPPAEYVELFEKYGYHSEGYVFEITKPEKNFRIDLE